MNPTSLLEQIDLRDVFGAAVRWIHLLSVIAAIGGVIFARVALLPAMSEVLPDDQRDRLRASVAKRWKMVVHVSVTLILVTGGINFYLTFGDGVKPIPYHPIFGLKLISAFVIFFLAIALSGSSPGFAGLRSNAKTWLGVIITLAVLIVFLSGVLRLIHQATMVGVATAAAGG